MFKLVCRVIASSSGMKFDIRRKKTERSRDERKDAKILYRISYTKVASLIIFYTCSTSIYVRASHHPRLFLNPLFLLKSKANTHTQLLAELTACCRRASTTQPCTKAAKHVHIIRANQSAKTEASGQSFARASVSVNMYLQLAVARRIYLFPISNLTIYFLRIGMIRTLSSTTIRTTLFFLVRTSWAGQEGGECVQPRLHSPIYDRFPQKFDNLFHRHTRP